MKIRHLLAALSIASIVSLAASAPARAQDATSKDAAAVIKSGFVDDLGELEKKFVALADAFPPDKYTWRPMEGVRSVSEVLMLAAFEGYSFIPNSFGAKPAELGSREEMAKLRTLSDKAQVTDHLKKGFAYAKQQIGALDAGTLTGKRKVMGQDMSVVQIADGIAGDLHEHLGQLIAYARMNHIVPPWSK
jgi:hypothetical protein